MTAELAGAVTAELADALSGGQALVGLGRHGWHLLLGTATGVALLTVALLPVAALVACALARVRVARGSSPRRAWRHSLTEVGLAWGTAPAVWLTMVPGGPRRAGAVSLVPLRDLATMSTFQVVGNLVLLSTLGFLVPLRFTALASFPRTVALAACCSTLIEVAQHVLRLDRVSSVDDVLLNTAGAGLAALASRPWRASRAVGGHTSPRVPSRVPG